MINLKESVSARIVRACSLQELHGFIKEYNPKGPPLHIICEYGNYIPVGIIIPEGIWLTGLSLEPPCYVRRIK